MNLSEMPDNNQQTPAIALREVRFAYQDAPQSVVIDIPQWTVSQGERIFLHGPSGSGKSSLMNLLSGLTVCTSGETAILGTRIDQLRGGERDQFRANNIGHVFQQFNLIPYLNARENIALAQRFCRAKDTQAEDDKERIDALLDRLDIRRQDQLKAASKLSIGQQQRVAIARALVNRPSLLIADEPTSSLDQENRNRFLSLLFNQLDQQAITLVFVSHDDTLADRFDQSVALNHINRAANPEL